MEGKHFKTTELCSVNLHFYFPRILKESRMMVIKLNLLAKIGGEGSKVWGAFSMALPACLKGRFYGEGLQVSSQSITGFLLFTLSQS